MPTTLERILATTRGELPSLHRRRAAVEQAALEAPDPPPLFTRWSREHLALIAEIKRRSPSAGKISLALDPVVHARAYVQAGASAISVLTDGPYFGGSLDDLRAVTAQVRAPALRKDFIIDELQIAEARAAGGSAVLLIARALSPGRLGELARSARDWKLDVLVEIHDASELEAALEAEVAVVGVNSRNLDTFEIDTAAAWELLGRVPADRIAIAESGMASLDDVRRAAEAGADGVLIGTALSASPDPSGLTRACAAVRRRGR